MVAYFLVLLKKILLLGKDPALLGFLPVVSCRGTHEGRAKLTYPVSKLVKSTENSWAWSGCCWCRSFGGVKIESVRRSAMRMSSQYRFVSFGFDAMIFPVLSDVRK